MSMSTTVTVAAMSSTITGMSPPRGDDAEKQYRHQIGEHQYHHRVDAYPQAVGGGAGYCQQGTQYEQLGEYHNADSTPLNPLGSLTGIPVPRLNALAL